MHGSPGAAQCEVRPDTVGSGTGDGKVACGLSTELLGDKARFQPGDSVDGQNGACVLAPAGTQVSVCVGLQRQDQWLVQVCQPGPQVHSAALQQAGGEAQTDGGVVVAAGQYHLGTRRRQPDQGVIQQAHDVDARQCAVVDITGDQDNVNRIRRDGADELINK